MILPVLLLDIMYQMLVILQTWWIYASKSAETSSNLLHEWL